MDGSPGYSLPVPYDARIMPLLGEAGRGSGGSTMRPLFALAGALVAGSLSSGALAAGATLYTPPLSSRGDDLHCSILNASSNTASATVTGFSNGVPSTDTL